MEIKQRIKKIIELLDKEYGTVPRCFLDYETPWQLLIATILSAQCTDACVNMVTKDLFKIYPTAYDMARASLKDVEKAIHKTGFYHNKARNIIACSAVIVDRYNGEIPKDMAELTSLPGVGRKTANVIRNNIYELPGIVVDTHVMRISRKLGVTKQEEQVKIEFDLMKKIPKDHWRLWNYDLVTMGRSVCKARNPECETCFLKDVCKENEKKKK